MSDREPPHEERPTLDVAAPFGGWPDPWQNVAELATALPTDTWTLVGGLMTQLHTIHRGMEVVRPTSDVDIVLHIETSRGIAAEAEVALRSLGYVLRTPLDPRTSTAHRFSRGPSKVDVMTEEVVDVLVSDHHAPRVAQRLAGREMIHIEGGTQALRRTINARLEISPGVMTTVSVPGVFGALILKAAAYVSDSRDRDRHVADAVALLACLDDPFAERERFAGSDRSRLRRLQRRLPAHDRAWTVINGQARIDAQTALEILTDDKM